MSFQHSRWCSSSRRPYYGCAAATRRMSSAGTTATLRPTGHRSAADCCSIRTSSTRIDRWKVLSNRACGHTVCARHQSGWASSAGLSHRRGGNRLSASRVPPFMATALPASPSPIGPFSSSPPLCPSRGRFPGASAATADDDAQSKVYARNAAMTCAAIRPFAARNAEFQAEPIQN